MINTSCHGCKQPMNIEPAPVTIRELTGELKTYEGKASSIWICKTCRQEPAKLKAARLAAGMPASPTLPASFEADEMEEAV